MDNDEYLTDAQLDNIRDAGRGHLLGETDFIDDSERASYTARARKAIATDTAFIVLVVALLTASHLSHVAHVHDVARGHYSTMEFGHN